MDINIIDYQRIISKKVCYAHRLVAEHFLPNPDNLPVVNHIDGNKQNNNVINLEWVSYSENVKHAHKNGLINPVSKSEYYISDFENEEWKRFADYDKYLISNYGRVRNINTNRILKPSLASGYYKVRLSKDGQVKDFLIHKLVYAVFHNEDYLQGRELIIDHMDANKLNNHINNLKKVTSSENALNAYYKQNANSSIKSINQYSLEGELLNTFPSIREASRQLGLDSSSLSKACKGYLKTCGGFKFKYV